MTNPGIWVILVVVILLRLAAASGASLSFPEYYERMLALAESYCKEARRMDVDIWQFLHLYPVERRFSVSPVRQGDGMYRGSAPVCRGNRGMIAKRWAQRKRPENV